MKAKSKAGGRPKGSTKIPNATALAAQFGNDVPQGEVTTYGLLVRETYDRIRKLLRQEQSWNSDHLEPAPDVVKDGYFIAERYQINKDGRLEPWVRPPARWLKEWIEMQLGEANPPGYQVPFAVTAYSKSNGYAIHVMESLHEQMRQFAGYGVALGRACMSALVLPAEYHGSRYPVDGDEERAVDGREILEGLALMADVSQPTLESEFLGRLLSLRDEAYSAELKKREQRCPPGCHVFNGFPFQFEADFSKVSRSVTGEKTGRQKLARFAAHLNATASDRLALTVTGLPDWAAKAQLGRKSVSGKLSGPD